LSIADEVGNGWSEKARLAATALSRREYGEDAFSHQTQLLMDIKDIFEKRGREKIRSTEILEDLNAMEDHPWIEWKDGRSLTAYQLAYILQEFKIYPKNIRIDEIQYKGYALDDFKDAFVRYL
jgi:hypothetical protein